MDSGDGLYGPFVMMADNVGETRTTRDLTSGVWRRLYVNAGIPVDVRHLPGL